MARSENDGKSSVYRYSDEELIYLTLLDDTAFLKITRSCNNECLFCCDTIFQDGGMMAPRLVCEKITEGARRGIKNLFLSGGEPTIHPEFISFIEFARKLGYEKIQAITNGRMFCYEEFAARAIGAGLDEIIFSVNSMNEKTHDTLVGVKGAFRQAVKGIGNVLEAGCRSVNVNVLVTSLNYTEMPDMPAFFKNLGASGVDFILVAPAGVPRDRSDHRLQPALNDLYPVFLHTLETAVKSGVRLGLKKFPGNFFEGREELLPGEDELYRELREIQRRRKLFNTALDVQTCPPCHDDQISFCFMGSFCRLINTLKRNFASGGFRYIRFSKDSIGVFRELLRLRPDIINDATLILRASDAAELAMLLAEVKRLKNPFFVDAADMEDIRPELIAARGEPRRITLGNPDAVVNFLASTGSDVEIVLNEQTLEWVNKNPKIVKQYKERIILSSGLPDTPVIRSSIRKLKLRVNGLPRCFNDGTDASPVPLLDVDTLADTGAIDIERAALWFTQEQYFTKSRRCGGCPEDDTCRGAPYEYVRRYGYGTLKPDADEQHERVGGE